MGAGGALSPKSPATVATGSTPWRGGGQPGRRQRLRHEPVQRTSVSQYDVGAGGALTPKSPATVAAGDDPVEVAVSPLARPTGKDQCWNTSSELGGRVVVVGGRARSGLGAPLGPEPTRGRMFDIGLTATRRCP